MRNNNSARSDSITGMLFPTRAEAYTAKLVTTYAVSKTGVSTESMRLPGSNLLEKSHRTASGQEDS